MSSGRARGAANDAPSVPVPARHAHLLGGERVASRSGATFTTADPSSGADIAEVALGDADDVDAAVGAAREALRAWSGMEPTSRGRVLHRLGELIEEHAEELALIESRDV